MGDLPVPRLDEIEALAAVVRVHAALGWPAGIVVANPPPAALALPRAELEAWIADAADEAASQGIVGKETTPFLLAALARLSGGRTVELNEALVLDNARVAAALAVALASPDRA